MQTIVNLVSAGLGVAWVPRACAQFQRPGVVYRTLRRRAQGPQVPAARPAWCGRPAARRRRRLSRFIGFVAAAHGSRSADGRGGHNTPHADVPADRSRRPPARPARHPLVRPDLPGRLRRCSIAWPRGACGTSPSLRCTGRRRLEPQGRRGHAVPRRAGRRSSAGASATACSTSRPTTLAHPLEIFFVWQGGMSFHGGMLGVIASQWWFARSRGKPFWQVMDFVAPCVPTGPGRRAASATSSTASCGAARPTRRCPGAWCSRRAARCMPRHPSQVYQFLLEGLLLFVLLWLYARKERKRAQVSAVFLIGYGVFRFIAEFFREPDDSPGPAGAGHEHGPVAVRADGAGRHRPVALGASGARPRTATATRSCARDEVRPRGRLQSIHRPCA